MFADTHTSLQCVYMIIKFTIFKYTSVYIPNFLVLMSWLNITLVETPNCSVYPFLASVCLLFASVWLWVYMCWIPVRIGHLEFYSSMWKPLEDVGLFLPEFFVTYVFETVTHTGLEAQQFGYPGCIAHSCDHLISALLLWVRSVRMMLF